MIKKINIREERKQDQEKQEKNINNHIFMHHILTIYHAWLIYYDYIYWYVITDYITTKKIYRNS